ncbi:MAG: PAS domain S-box protein [Chloroflexi bacterium]|nr:MAG: PAS domain S-box protein [Chloroflexota bacterium]
MTVLTGSYDLWLVALSVVIAILAAGAALDVVARVAATRGQARAAWLVGGAVAMGLGIWSMHYTGMLAFRLPVPVLYHVPTVTLSLLAAVAASLMALHVASREHLSRARTAVGSVVMGSGIAAMHYTGMAAMRLPATARWHPVLVILSVLIAIGVSAVALWLAFHHGHGPRGAWTWPKLGSAVLMGLAIPSMHYTGMAAATFVSAPDLVASEGAVAASALGTLGIVGTTVLVLGLAILTSLVARHGESQLRASTERLRHTGRQLAEAQAIAHVGSWEWDIATGAVTWSDEQCRLFGIPVGSPASYDEFVTRVHPEDRDRVERIIARGVAERRREEYEWRLVRSDGEIRHMHTLSVVVTDSAGKPVRMAGTSVDITERKTAEENQQALLRELQTALAEVRTLQGWIKICATCKRVLTDQGGWEQFESYVRGHSDVDFSHGICPDCARKWAADGA